MLHDPLLGEQNDRPGTEFRLGTAQFVDGHMRVFVGGVAQACRYIDPTTLRNGDPVLVAYIGGSTGQSQAVCLGRTTDQPVVEDTSDPGPAPPVAPPPGGGQVGTAMFPAIDSGTARVGSGWNSPSGQNLWQGSYGGPAFAGAWFYGTGPSGLAGRTITGARLLLGARRHMGNHNSPATINLYAHNSATRPVGDVTRTSGAYGVVMQPGSGGGWVNIPLPYAAQIIAGGGISIAGNPYAGIVGRGEDPNSGLLAIDWRV